MRKMGRIPKWNQKNKLQSKVKFIGKYQVEIVGAQIRSLFENFLISSSLTQQTACLNLEVMQGEMYHNRDGCEYYQVCYHFFVFNSCSIFFRHSIRSLQIISVKSSNFFASLPQ